MNLEAILPDFSPRWTGREADALGAGEDAGSALRVEGVDGEDFWKNPSIDFWFFIF